MWAMCVFLGLVVTTQAEMEGFIVGGGSASIKNFPHSAFLMVSCVSEIDFKLINWICGSSIINQQLLLTAGHCVYPCGAGTRITVNMGNNYRYNGTSRSSSGYILHEKYNPDNSAFDIALIKMLKPVQFNAKIGRVAIMKNPPYNEPAVLAGWGMTNEESKAQGYWLKQLKQKVWKHSSCLQMFGILPKGTICASSRKRGDYAAVGDSGSGLLVRGYIQIGLVSYKTPELANNVIIYTDVGYFYSWIIFNAKRLYCSSITV